MPNKTYFNKSLREFGLSRKLQEATAGLGRVDLVISQVQKVEKNAKIALCCDANKKLTKAELQQFFTKHLPEINPHLDTAVKRGGAVVLFASFKRETRSYEDASKMTTVVADLKFLDADLGTYWETQEVDGEKILQQTVKSDIKTFIEERARRMGRVLAHRVEITAIVGNLAEGDHVKYWANNHRGSGLVKKLDGSDVHLLCDETDTDIVVDKDGVYKITKPSKKKEKAMTKYEDDYYSKVFGPKYAKELVKK